MFNFNVRPILATLLFTISLASHATSPAITNTLPAEGLAGQQVCFDTSVTNTGAAGFGPYVRIFSDAQLTVDSASAFGQAVSITNVGTFPLVAPFELEDPLTETTVTGLPGQSFSIVRKLVGSVIENGPDITTNVCLSIDASADIGVPLNLSLTPVFQFGDTSTGINGPVEGSAQGATITPTLFDYSFSASAPEQEKVPSASSLIQFVHTIDVADGSAINQSNIEQSLDAAFSASGVPTVSGGVNCNIDSAPVSGGNGGNLAVSCDQVNGSNSEQDLQVSYSALVNDVLNAATCAALPITSEGDANAEFPIGNPLATAEDNSTLTIKHITAQQSISSNIVVPGDSFTITNAIQISDYATPDTLVIVDTLDDGLAFNNNVSLTIGGANFAVTAVETTNGGQEVITFDLSSLFQNNAAVAASKTITLSYSVLVESTFISGDNVLANDGLGASTELSYGLTGGASNCSEDSSASTRVEPLNITKTIIGGLSDFDPGEGIGFRLNIDIPSGDIDSFTVIDYLPLAVFDVNDLSATFGTDVFFSANNTLAVQPTSLTLDTSKNAIVLEFPSLTNVESTVIEIDVQTAISTDPYADGLFLTNIMELNTANTSGDTTSLLSPVSFTAKAPVLEGTLSQTLPTIKDGNDEIAYELELENVGGASAFEIGVVVPSASGLDTATLDTLQILNSDGSVADASPATTGSLSAGNLVITGPLAPTQKIVMTFDRLIADDVQPAQTITSVASAVWTTGPSFAPFPAIETDIEFTADDFTIATAIESVSPGGSLSSEVVVGDTVGYRTSVTMPESEVDDFTVTIALPAGFEYVANSAASDNAGFNGSIPGTINETITGTVAGGQTVSLALSGTLVTTSDNLDTNDSFGITFDAVVADDTANAAKSNTQTKTLNTSAAFTGSNGSNSAAAVDASFAEHDLKVTTTAVRGDGATGGFEFGDEVTISVTVENVGTAPAYDVALTSIVNGDLFDLTSVAEVTTPAGYTYAFASPNVSYAGVGDVLAVGNSITFVYKATVKQDVASGSNFNIDNTASGSSQTGTPTIERTGNTEETALLSTESPAIGNLEVINTSEAWTGTASLDLFAIGEVVTYEFEATMPEGVTLARDGLSYMFEVVLPLGYQYQASSALIRGEFDTSLVSADLGALSSTNTAITPSLSGNRIRFALGDITNNDDDMNEEKIIITFDMLVLNTRNNNRNNLKKVNAALVYENQDNQRQSRSTSAVSRIAEPRLSLDYKVRASTVNGGATVFYDTTVRNLNGRYNTRAWDFELVQTLPDELTPLSVVSAVLSRGNTDISACVSLAGQIYTLDTSCLSTGDEYLNKNERITVRIEAEVDPEIQFEQQATGRATFTATSLPGTNGTADATPGAESSDTGERTGSRLANTSGQSVNDLYLAKTSTITAESPTVEMTLSDEIIQVGETLTITANVALPTGTTDDFNVVLTLPTGLVYNDETIRITEPGSDYSASLTPNINPGIGSNPITLDFGTIANSASQPQEVLIEFDVVVDNILSNQNGTVLRPSVALDYASQARNESSSAADVTVVEANLELTQTVIQGATDSDAGDTIRYRTSIKNTSGQATAYNVSLQDVLDAQLLGAPDGTGSGVSFVDIVVTNDANQVVQYNSNTAITASDFVEQTTNTSDDTLALNGTMDMPANSELIVEYSVVVSNSAVAGSSLDNNSSLSYNSNLAADSRSGADANSDDDDDADLDNYNESASSTIVLADSLAIQSRLADVHSDNDFAPGESVFIEIRLDINEGQEPNTVITNTLPSGLEFVEASIEAPANISFTNEGAGSVSGNDVTIDLGTVTNAADNDPTNDFVIVTVEARVLDVPANVEGTELDNSVVASAAGSNVGPSALSVDIVEPDVSARITPSASIVTLGDVVTFQVDISASDFAADAFDTSFGIAIPDGFTYQAGSLAGPGIIDDSNASLLNIDLGALAADDGVKTFIFEAQLDNDSRIGVDFDFSIENGSFSSQAGEPADDRTYGFTGSTSVSSDDASFIDANQTLSLQTDVNGNGIADPGDTLSKSVDITNNGPRVSGVVFTEDIPANTSYVTSSLTSTQGTLDDTSGISVDIGEMLPNDTVTIEFSITVDAGTPTGTVIVAQGSVDSDKTIPELTDSDGIDSNGDQANQIRIGEVSALTPSLQVTQNISQATDTDSNNVISAGDVLSVTYTLSNTGTQALTNLVLSDLIPTGLTNADSTAIISGPADANDTINVTADAINVSIAELAAGEIITVTVLVDIDSPLVNEDGIAGTEVFRMQGSLDSDQTDPILADGNANPDDGAQATTITAVENVVDASPSISVAQSYVLVNDIDGDGLVDPGDTVRYITTVTNSGAATAADVSANQAIPANTTVVDGSRATSRGVITDAGAGNFDANIGSIAPGETVTTSFDVTIDALTVNTLISSQQQVSGGNFTSVDSDANADLSDGATPTLFNVSVTSAPEYTLTTVLSDTSDPSTSANNFIQGETLTLSFEAQMPAGVTRDARMFFDLPTGFENIDATARIKRVFDTNISSSSNPGEVNAASSDTFVNITPSFELENGTDKTGIFVDLGNVISADTDADGASYVIELVIDTASLVPTQETQSFTIASNLQFNDEIVNAQQEDSSDVVVVLNNRPPAAVNDIQTVLEDSDTVTLFPLINDTDPDIGQTLTIASVGMPTQGGSVSFNSILNTVDYQPAPDFNGTESIPYTVSDGAGGTTSALLIFTVTPTSDDPIANNDTASTNEDETVTIDVLANDTDADGDVLSVTSASSASGTVTINGDGDLVFTPNTNFNGTATITYTISDGNGGNSTATVSVNVAAVNDPPVVPDQTLSTNEDTPLTINLLMNATDAENDSLNVTNVNASVGTATLNGDGTLNYVPPLDFTGPVTITYTVDDGNGGTTNVTVTINVIAQNDAPVANNDTASTNEDTPVTIDVLANDSDVDGDTITVTSASSADGTVVINGDGDLVFTPNADFNGETTITYSVSDGNGGIDTATVTVSVVAVNDVPVVSGQNLTTDEDTPITFDPLLNASDADGDTLSVTDIVASSGTVNVNPDGSLEFVPDPDFNGPVTITYNVDDGNGGVVAVTTTIDVTPQSDPPVANPDSATVDEDSSVNIDVLANDSDPDGDAISVTNAASNDGDVVVNPDGSIDFTPAPDFNGIAVITYTLTDANGEIDTGTVTVNVTPINDPPVVSDQIIAATEDTPVTFDPLANGIDADGDELTISDIVVSEGSITQNEDGTFTYTPDPDFNGPVVVTYTVDDGNGGTITVTVTINVEAEIDPPVATPDTSSVEEDSSVTIDALANDTDPDGDTLSITDATSPDGTVSINDDGDVVFTPNPDFTGTATIQYTLSDGTGETATGTISVDVTPVNDAPVASDQILSMEEDGSLDINPLINASDVDGDTLSITDIVVSSGTVTENPDGTITYTPDPNFNGPVTITYVVDDGNGGTTPVTITVNVQAVVDAPVANPDTATTNEDETVTVDVLANDTDAENEVLSVIQATSDDGTVEIDGNGNVIFTPNENFNGVAIINYVVQDTSGQVGTSTVTIDVLPINDLPIADDISVSIDEDTVLNIDVIAQASDPDGDMLSILDISTDVGEVTIGPDGTVFFTPPLNYNGPAVITYTLDDGNGGTTTAQIIVDVQPINDPPAIDDTAITVEGNQSNNVDIFDLIDDVDSSEFEIVSATVSEGTIVINPDGTVSIETPFGFEGVVTAEVCVRDDAGAEVCATITITVVITNTPPVAEDLNFITNEDTSVLIPILATDAQLDPITYSLLSMPEGMLIGSAPNFTYVPSANFNGTTSFTYRASDGEEDSNIATVNITVVSVNDAPVAIDDIVELNDQVNSTTIDVLANDIDADGDDLSIVSARATIGDVAIVDGQLVYTPIDGFVGTAVIDYIITDADGETSEARVLISIGRAAGSLNPVIDVPDDIFIDATALYTKVDLGVATAVDRFGNPLPVSVIDGLILYEPGVNTVFYVAEDSEGRRSVASQLVRVNPLISIQKDQTVLEGRNMRVSVHLNGQSPVYPLVVPFEVSGTADGGDHNLIAGEVVFNNVTETFIDFEGFVDQIDEGIETIVITLSDTVNLGNKFEHVIEIREDNVNPDIDLVPVQNNIQTTAILNTAGLVTVNSVITHPDPNNEYSFDWSNIEGLLIDVDDSDATFTFDPSDIPVGVYQINVEITDTDDPSFTDNTVLFIEVRDSLPVLGDGDADLDGITDLVEGFNDSDGDGIPDYLDAIGECNVLPEEVDSLDAYLVEGDPGVCLRIGNFALGQVSGGARLLDSDLGDDKEVPVDPIATNIGGIFDFIAYGLPVKGQSYRVVLPQRRPVPEDAVYRKYTEEDGWQFFDENNGNRLWSTPGEPGFCPPPGGDYWTPGLNPGHWCVQLEIVDGGANDADDMANKNIIDPGFVGVVFALPNALPEAIDDMVETQQDTSITIDAIANDTDADFDNLTITSVNSFFGQVSIVGNQVVYVPQPGFSGMDEISYGISDGNGGTDVGVIFVNVIGNMPPIAVDDTATAVSGESVSIDVLANDSDPDAQQGGAGLIVTNVSSNDGTVVILPNGSIQFTPNVGVEGEAIVTYTVTDEQGLIAIATVRINVAGREVRIENKSTGGGAIHLVWLLFGLLALLFRWREQALYSGLNFGLSTSTTPRNKAQGE